MCCVCCCRREGVRPTNASRPARSSAATRLQALTAGRSIVCQEKDRDRYGRIVAICRASGEDLGAIMVREGLALAFTCYGADHVADQQRAGAGRRGLRARNCAAARDYRAKSQATVLP
jgi:endonuclease YncB( thermonuclease family)